MTKGLAGYMDESVAMSVGYGELIDAVLDYVPDLTWPLSVRTYSRMRWDPQLKAILSAYTLPIRRATWQIDGTGCKPVVVQNIADDLGLPIMGTDPEPTGLRRRNVDWHEHLRLALLDLVFGYMPFEQLWEQEADGLMHLTALSERMPQTIEAVKIDPNTGSITSIMQFIRAGSSKPPEIPAQNLVWYSHDHEGAAWFGQSLLRASYSLWLIKDQVMRVHATSIRRFGLGILEVQAPPGATPAQVATAQQYAASIKASDQSGAGLPSGFTSQLRGLTGTVPDAVAFITYLDQQMTRSTLSSILDMATTTNGTQALGTVIIDAFMLALQAIADEIAQIANAQIIVPLVTANYGEDEPAPQIVCSDVGADHQTTPESLALLLESGAIVADPALDAFLRTEFKLPARTIPWALPLIEKPPKLSNV